MAILPIGLLVLAQAPALFQIVGVVLVILAGAAAQRYGGREIAVIASDTEVVSGSTAGGAEVVPGSRNDVSEVAGGPPEREEYGFPQGG